jgi:hypothetical protein
MANWLKTGGHVLPGDDYFPPLAGMGKTPNSQGTARGVIFRYFES